MTAGQFHPRQGTMFRAPLTHPRWPMNRKQRRASGKDRQQRSHGDTAEAVDQALKTALGRHRAGRLDEAAQLCADVLAREPDRADALHLLGVIRYQTGDAHAAVELIRKATRAAPDDAEAHHNLGNILKEQGESEAALAAFESAVSGWGLRVMGKPNDPRGEIPNEFNGMPYEELLAYL